MMNLACSQSGEAMESVYLKAGGPGEGPESGWLVMVVKNVWLHVHSEALFRIRRQS